MQEWANWTINPELTNLPNNIHYYVDKVIFHGWTWSWTYWIFVLCILGLISWNIWITIKLNKMRGKEE